MKPKYAAAPRRTNEQPPALLGVLVRIGTVPAGQRIPDHQGTVRSALALYEQPEQREEAVPKPRKPREMVSSTGDLSPPFLRPSGCPVRSEVALGGRLAIRGWEAEDRG
jgi:hypothetical protein